MLKKTLNAFKNPQLKKKSTAVSLFLEVNGKTYLGDDVAAAAGDGGPLVGAARDAGKDAMSSQVATPRNERA